MQTMIEGYRNHPGEHCGSVAMRGLLGFYCELELPEDVLFGLGSGVLAGTATGSLPSTSVTTRLAGSPAGPIQYASRVPSRDQVGSETPSSPDVICRRSLPSGSMT